MCWEEKLRRFTHVIDESVERPGGFRFIVQLPDIRSSKTGRIIAGWGQTLEEAAKRAFSQIPEEIQVL